MGFSCDVRIGISRWFPHRCHPVSGEVMNDFDQTCRYIVKLDPPSFYRWLFGEHVPLQFRGWYDARTLSKPGTRDRTGDLVALFGAFDAIEVNSATITEFQTENDAEILERLHEEIARYRREFRSQKWNVFGAAINLTGPEQSSELVMEMPGRPAIGSRLGIEIRTMRNESAQATLAAITAGKYSRSLLPWIPLMRGSGEPGRIEEWHRMAESEPDANRRADFGGLARNWLRLLPDSIRQCWQEMFKEFNMTKSPFLEEIRAEERLKTKQNDLLRAIQFRFRTSVPAELVDVVNAANDERDLDRWFEATFTSSNLEEIRAAVGH